MPPSWMRAGATTPPRAPGYVERGSVTRRPDLFYSRPNSKRVRREQTENSVFFGCCCCCFSSNRKLEGKQSPACVETMWLRGGIKKKKTWGERIIFTSCSLENTNNEYRDIWVVKDHLCSTPVHTCAGEHWYFCFLFKRISSVLMYVNDHIWLQRQFISGNISNIYNKHPLMTSFC